MIRSGNWSGENARNWRVGTGVSPGGEWEGALKKPEKQLQNAKHPAMMKSYGYIWQHNDAKEDFMNQEKRKAINKLSIECAAVELFSQRSFAAVSMNEIAEAAGLSKRTVYKYFESKDALISSLFEKYQQNHYAELTKVLSACPRPEEALITCIRTIFDYTRQNLPFMKMLWSVNDENWLNNLPPDLVERILGWNNMIFQYTADHIRGIQLRGTMADYTAESLTHYISAVNKGAFIQAHKGTNRNLTETTPETLIQMEIDMFRQCMEA